MQTFRLVLLLGMLFVGNFAFAQPEVVDWEASVEKNEDGSLELVIEGVIQKGLGQQ